jgi:hypothetical protein
VLLWLNMDQIRGGLRRCGGHDILLVRVGQRMRPSASVVYGYRDDYYRRRFRYGTKR